MSQLDREIGGSNNRKGNRYEDAFAVARLIELTPRVIDDRVTVRIKEQAGCHVDDFLIREAARQHYYQVKDDQQITWGRDHGKLATEFTSQKSDCDLRGEEYSLTIVVSEDHRKESLDKDMPATLIEKVTVLHFPRVRRPSELQQRPALQHALRRLTASREPGPSHLQEVVEGFHLAWVECDLDAEGYGNLEGMVAWLLVRPLRIRRPLPASFAPNWVQCEAILSAIPGLEFHIDRGYFEWFRRPVESGLTVRCDDPAFQRFVDRVVDTPPVTFEEFERLLP